MGCQRALLLVLPRDPVFYAIPSVVWSVVAPLWCDRLTFGVKGERVDEYCAPSAVCVSLQLPGIHGHAQQLLAHLVGVCGLSFLPWPLPSSWSPLTVCHGNSASVSLVPGVPDVAHLPSNCGPTVFRWLSRARDPMDRAGQTRTLVPRQ